MGGIGSGPREEGLMTMGQVRALYAGLDLETPEGLRAFLRRADKLSLQGKMNPRRYELLIRNAGQQRSLLLNADAERRIKRLEAITKQLNEQTVNKAGLRDIGPPEDSLTDAEVTEH